MTTAKPVTVLERIQALAVHTDALIHLPFPKPIKRVRPRKPIARRALRIRRQRKTNVAGLKRRLWGLFSLYVKERDGNQCFTCPARPEGHAWHAGHMIRSTKASVRYDPANVHSQCSYCNKWLHGNEAVYAERHIETYGFAKFRALMARSRVLHHWTAPELRELIAALEKSGADYETLYAEKYGLSA